MKSIFTWGLLILTTGLALLSLSLFGMLTEGYGRSTLFAVLGSLITVHGYWVLKQEVEKENISVAKNMGTGKKMSDTYNKHLANNMFGSHNK